MSISSIQQGHNKIGAFKPPVKSLSPYQQKMSQKVVFESVKDVDLRPSSNLVAINKAIEFNRIRLDRAQVNSLIYKRLNQRVKDLVDIKKAFEKNSDNAFIGLIGWGEGCIQSGIQSRQNISSVDGFLYKDKNGHIHYQRLGSCLEYFLKPVSKPVIRSPQSSQCEVPKIYTENGKDINFNNQTVYDGKKITKLNHSFSISSETIAIVCGNINQEIAAHACEVFKSSSKIDSDDEGGRHLSGTKKVSRDFDYLEVDQFTGESKWHKLQRERRERRLSYLKSKKPLDSMSMCLETGEMFPYLTETYSRQRVDIAKFSEIATKKCGDPKCDKDHLLVV